MTIRAFSGFEGVSKEVAGYVGRVAGAAANVTVQSVIVHAGRYAGRINSTGATSHFQLEFEQNDPTTWLAARGYAVAGTGCFVELQVWLDSLPAVDTEIATIVAGPSGTTGAIRIVLTPTGALKLQYNASGGWTAVGSASSALSTGAWHKVQFAVTGLLNSGTTSVGTAELIIDGSAIASGSSLPIIADTKYRWVWLGNDATSSTYRVYFDDVIVDDTAYPTVALCEVPVLLPDSAGTDSAWTGTFADVDETPPDDNTSYITITANGAHTFGMSSAASSHILSDTNIKAVQAVAYINMVNTDVATRTQTRVRSGATIQDTAWSVAPGDGFYGPSRILMLTDPNTGAAWTKAALDALEIGVSKTSGIQEVRTTAVYASILAPLVDREPAPSPIVTSISPTTGPKAGGTAVTITGTNFTLATQVLIGGVAATGMTVVSDTSITCTTAAASKAGIASVTVVAPQGAGTLLNAFTFTPGNSTGNSGNNGGGSTSLVVSVPTSADGNTQIAVITVRGTATTVTQASWGTAIDVRSDGTTASTHTFRKKASSEPASYTFTLGTSGKASGVITTTPDIDYEAGFQVSSQSNGSSTSITAPTLTPTKPGSVSIFGGGLARGDTIAPPTNYTEPANGESASTGGGAASRTTTEQAYRQLATLTATGPVIGTAGTADDNVGVHVMLVPPTTVSPTSIASAQTFGTPTLVAGDPPAVQPRVPRFKPYTQLYAH